MTKSIIDIIGREEAFKLMEKAVLKVADENARLGLPKAVKIDGVVHRQHADGTLERVSNKAAEPAKAHKKTYSRAA